MPREFINVKYGQLHARINIASMTNFHELEDAVKKSYKNHNLHHIWFFDRSNNQIDSLAELNALPDEYFAESEFSHLNIQLAYWFTNDNRIDICSFEDLGVSDVHEYFEAAVMFLIKSEDWRRMKKKSNPYEALSAGEPVDFDPPIRLPIQHQNGIFDALSVDSHEIYDALHTEVGYQPPFKRLESKLSSDSVAVIAGPSGCGKSRVLLDYGAEKFAFFFECNQNDVPRDCSSFASDFNCYRIIYSMLFVRAIAFETLRRIHGDRLTPAVWIDYQRGSTQFFSQIFCLITSAFSAIEWNQVEPAELYWKDVSILVDDAHYLFIRNYRIRTSLGKDVNFFRVFVDYLRTMSRTKPSIFCGTRSVLWDLDFSANRLVKFHSFDYLQPELIERAFRRWIRDDLLTDGNVLREVSIMLQGRPRFSSQAVAEVCLSYQKMKKKFEFKCALNAISGFMKYVTANLSANYSTYQHWERSCDFSAEPYMGLPETPDRNISNILTGLLLRYYMGSGTDLLPRLSEIEGDIFASTLATLIPLEDGDYRVIINEPVIVFAAENLFDQAGKNWIQEAFGKQLIQHAAKITVAEKSNLIESLIAYRFRQRWWEKSGALRELFNGTQWFEFLRSPPLPDDYPYYLPSIFNFVEDENFHRHFTGTIRDCTQFASLRLPSTNEPPNIVFKDKLGFVKTNWSKRQKCEPENSNALLDDATKIPNETHRKFLKFRIELPFSSDPNFKQHDLENGIVNIDLSQRQLAIDLLGETFYEKYCQFIGQFLES